MGDEELRTLDQQIAELKSAYVRATDARTELLSRRSRKTDRLAAFHTWRKAGTEYFNAFDRRIVVGARSSADRDPAWRTDCAETAADLLRIIVLHYNTLFDACPDLELQGEAYRPTPGAFAGMQRLVRGVGPRAAQEIREEFVRLGLPTRGFDTSESEKSSPHLLEPRFFIVGCVLTVFALAAGAWGFAIGELTSDRRSILLWILPLASGFAAWSFAGSIAAKGKGLQGFAVAATGGFVVWLLSNYFLFRQ